MYIGQFLDGLNVYNKDAVDFLEHSRMLIREVLVGFLFVSIVIFCFLFFNSNFKYKTVGLSTRRRCYLNFKRLSNFYLHYRKRQHLLTKVNMIMMCYTFFYFICVNAIVCNIESNDLIIDKRDLIDSGPKLLTTKRYDLSVC